MLELPGGQTTMIGSMPHATAEEAFKALEKFPLNIPSWPQLPQRSFLEGMIPQCSEGFPGIQYDPSQRRISIQRDNQLVQSMADFYEHVINDNAQALAISETYANGLHYFLGQLRESSSPLPFVKGQITGPFTFGLGLNDQEKTPVWFDEQYRDIVLKGLSLKAQWLIRELENYAQQVLLFMDEPILSAIGTPAYIAISDEQVIAGLNEVILAAHDAGALVGIHCCGNMDWGLLARTEVDIIAFDAYFYGDKIALYPELIESFLQRGGILAYGLVPTLEPDVLEKETLSSLQTRLESLLERFVNKGITENRLRRQMLFTPSCGMGSGSLTRQQTQHVLELLAGLSCCPLVESH